MVIKKKYSGLSLIEMVLAIGLMILLLGISSGLYQNVLFPNEVEATRTQIVEALYYAQTAAVTGKNDGMWGVHITTNTVEIFMGSSYATRDVNTTVSYSLSGNCALQGPLDVVFTKRVGTPSATGTIVISKDTYVKSISISDVSINKL